MKKASKLSNLKGFKSLTSKEKKQFTGGSNMYIGLQGAREILKWIYS